MRRYIPLALLPLLAACDPSVLAGLGLPGTEPPEPEPVVYPPAVIAALPPGAPPSVVIQTPDGCYLYSIEVTDPPSGFPLRGPDGQQICDTPVAAG